MWTYVFTRYNHVLKINERMVINSNARLMVNELEGYKAISGWELVATI